MARRKKHSKFTYEEYDYNTLNTYAGIDCIVTSDLFAVLSPSLQEIPIYWKYQNGEKIRSTIPSVIGEQADVKAKALEFLCDLEIAGMAYDVPANREMNRQMEEELALLEDEIFTAIGKKIDLNSSDALKDFLYVEKGFASQVQTKTGDDATSGDALKGLFKTYGHDWLKLIGKRNDISSIHNSFVRTYIPDWVKPDSRVHPLYNLHGTSSHRISSSKPNLLNLPTEKHGYHIRRLYTVQGDMIFITFDFSSCEVKILAALCQDENMIKAIESGLDFHSYTASLMYNVPYEELVAAVEDEEHPDHKKFKAMRQGAKAVTFGLLYGSSVGGIARTLGATIQEAQVIIDAYFDSYPRVGQFIADCHSMARENQYIVTPFAQRKMEYGTLPIFRGSAVYNGALRNSQNVAIQSPASTLGLLTFAKMNEEMKKLGGRCVCTVYDSIEIEIPLSRAAEAINIGFMVMDEWPQSMFDWLTFPIGSDGEIGWNWGDVHKVSKGITQAEVVSILAKADPERYAEVLMMAA